MDARTRAGARVRARALGGTLLSLRCLKLRVGCLREGSLGLVGLRSGSGRIALVQRARQLREQRRLALLERPYDRTVTGASGTPLPQLRALSLLGRSRAADLVLELGMRRPHATELRRRELKLPCERGYLEGLGTASRALCFQVGLCQLELRLAQLAVHVRRVVHRDGGGSRSRRQRLCCRRRRPCVRLGGPLGSWCGRGIDVHAL